MGKEPPGFADSSSPGDERPRLTPREQAIRDELRLIDVHLAGLFEVGISTLAQIERPGNVYVLAHVGRELSLGVVAALTAQGVAGPPPAADSLPEGEEYTAVIAGALGLPPSHPIVRAWHATYRALQGSAHYRRGGQAPSPDDVARSFTSLGDMLFGRIAPYFQTQDELEALLAIEEPEAQHVEQLQRLLLRPTQRAYFFRRLTHRGWLRRLLEAGLFASPPDVTLDAADARYSWTPWPEGDYLVRMAKQEPELVFKALEGIPARLGNPVVWYNVAMAAKELPTNLSRELVPKFRSALAGPVLFLFPLALVDLAVTLANGGEVSAAFELASRLTDLDVKRGDQRSPMAAAFDYNDIVLKRLPNDHIGDLVERLFPALERADAARCLELLAKRTAFAIRGHRADDQEDTHRDYSASWCEDLERGDSPRHELRATLLRALAGVACRYAARDQAAAAGALSVLGRYDFDAFRRVELLVLAEVGALFPDRIDAALLDRRLIDGALGEKEYGPLVARHFRGASAAARGEFVAILTAGPDRNLVQERLGTWLGRDVTGEEVDEHVSVWQLRRIGWFGDEVPDELRALATELAEVKARIAAQEEALEVQAAAIAGERPQSPLTPEELREMTPAQLVAYLTTWEPKPGDLASPEGLARVLRDVVVEDPGGVVGLVDALDGSAS